MKPLESLANFKFVQADLLDGPAVDAIIAHASAVIHVGAIPGPSKFPPPGIDPKFGTKEVAPIGLEDVTPGELLKQNLMGTFNVFESACKWGVKRVVFSSTAFTMGWSHDPTTFYPQWASCLR